MQLIFLARSNKKETFPPAYCTVYNIYVFRLTYVAIFWEYIQGVCSMRTQI